MMKNDKVEDIKSMEGRVIEAYRDRVRDLPGLVQSAYMKWKSGEIKAAAGELWSLYEMCEYQVKNKTPDGWDAEIEVAYCGQPYCYAERTIDGLIENIPAKVDGWEHGAFANGVFGYKLISGGSRPWILNSDSGARVVLEHSPDSAKTNISVSSHPDDYKFAMRFAQSLVKDALSGRLKVAH